MALITVSVDTCLSRQVFDSCKKQGQKIWWIKKAGANKFVDIGRNNRADKPLNIRVEFPELGDYLVGCGPDAKEGGIRAKITIQEPAAKVEPKAPATVNAKATVTPEPAAKVEPKAPATANAEATAAPEPAVASSPAPAGAEDQATAAPAESRADIAATLKNVEGAILKTLAALGQEKGSVEGRTVRARHKILDLLERNVRTDISYQQHILCRIEEARISGDESPDDIALLFVWKAVRSLAAARRIIG